MFVFATKISLHVTRNAVSDLLRNFDPVHHRVKPVRIHVGVFCGILTHGFMNGRNSAPNLRRTSEKAAVVPFFTEQAKNYIARVNDGPIYKTPPNCIY